MIPVTARFSLYAHPNNLIFERYVSLQFPPFVGMSIGGFTVDAINVEPNGKVTCTGAITAGLNTRPMSDKVRDAYIASMQRGGWRMEVMGPGIEQALAATVVDSLKNAAADKSYSGGTATEEHFQKLNAPAAGHTAPDDAEIAELYTQIRAASQENERLKAVNQEMVDRYESQLTVKVQELEKVRRMKASEVVAELDALTNRLFESLPRWKPEHVQAGVSFRLGDSNWVVENHFSTADHWCKIRREAASGFVETCCLPKKYVVQMMNDAGDRVGGIKQEAQ